MTNPNNELTAQTATPAIATATANPPTGPTIIAPSLLERTAASTALATPQSQPPVQTAAEDGLPSNTPFPLQFMTAPLESLQNRRPSRPRNGKIAHLPKLEREMVNRMLSNNLPQEKIASAMSEFGYHVTQRNISNWKTRGGYKEWCAAEARALELRTFQDNLTSFLRRHDASELPEVGLQAAATNLSAILLRPDLMRELLSNPEKYSKLIELDCRLARELQALQKNRDDASRSVHCNPERSKRKDEQEVERIREVYSSKGGKSAYDPDIPHRNFIPKELEPLPSLTR